MDVWTGTATDYERTQDALLQSGITDGLPVIPPTAERVDRMLAAAGCDPDGRLGVVAPMFVEATWRDAAINAVMAGCTPACLPVVGAAVSAMAASEFNMLGITTTTGSACPIIIVNGPIVEKAGLNSGANALGPGNRANATIGRAISLILRNVAGAKPGEIDMATLGQPGKYTFCFAENEALNPWEPLHVERGFERGQSVVTVVGVSGNTEIVDGVSVTAADLAQTLAASMLAAGNISSSGTVGGGEPVLVLPPEHADMFHREGCTKLDAKKMIFDRARLPLDWLSVAMREKLARPDADHPEDFLQVAEKPENIIIVVAGGVGRKAACIPSWSGSTQAVSRVISG